VTAVEWDAEAYHRLGNPQHAWGKIVLERLLARLRGDEVVVDAGCGSGRVTAELLERAPGVKVLALDRSQNMLRTAEASLAPRFGGRVSFACVDLAALELVEVADVVFSTATLHWVTNHPKLFAGLFRALRPGGLLLAQCGGGPNLARIVRRAESLMAREPWAPSFDGWNTPWEFADDDVTARRLDDAGFVEVETSLERAPTVLGGESEYREFLGSVVFATHLARIAEPERRASFVEELVRQGKTDDPPWSLDYWRLTMAARRRP
jgi:trans-aconitate 2-methyltransferase